MTSVLLVVKFKIGLCCSVSTYCICLSRCLTKTSPTGTRFRSQDDLQTFLKCVSLMAVFGKVSFSVRLKCLSLMAVFGKVSFSVHLKCVSLMAVFGKVSFSVHLKCVSLMAVFGKVSLSVHLKQKTICLGLRHLGLIFTTRCYAQQDYAITRCPSICLSHASILSKQSYISFHFTIRQPHHSSFCIPNTVEYSDG